MVCLGLGSLLFLPILLTGYFPVLKQAACISQLSLKPWQELCSKCCSGSLYHSSGDQTSNSWCTLAVGHTPSSPARLLPANWDGPLRQILRVHHQWYQWQMETLDNQARDLPINHKNFIFPVSQSVFIKTTPFDKAVFFRAEAVEKHKSSVSGPTSSEGPWELGRETAKFKKPSCEGGRTLLKCPFRKGTSLLGLKCYLCYHPR